MRHGNRTMWIVAAVVIAAVAVIGLRRQTRTPAPARIANLPPRFTDVTIAAELSFEHENGARGQRAMPEIMGVYRMSGELDYLIRAQVADMAGYDRLYQSLIRKVPLSDVSASFVMEEIKETTALPL